MKVSVVTLGCKVNQYDSGGVINILSERGIETVEGLVFADAYIINTCAVTREAERKSRETVTKCLKLNPEAKVFVMGCASQKNPVQFEEKSDRVVYVNGNGDKKKVASLIEGVELSALPTVYEEFDTAKTEKTRAFVKVQDGCNNFCSYCIVPYLRGRSRSREIDKVTKEISALQDVNEVVLCGINLSDYRFGDGLISLAEAVDKCGIRFRFGSLEERVITDDFLARLKKLDNFCPQFHLSLQSGSDTVLKRMNRKYTASEYIAACEKIKSAFENANITTDAIVGFPGETEEEFEETVTLAKTVGFGDMHVFPFSKREGTVAAKMEDMPKSVKTERAKRLSEVAKGLKDAYIDRFLGKTLTALTEDIENGMRVGYTENYVKVYLPDTVSGNTLIKVVLDRRYGDGAIAKIAE